MSANWKTKIICVNMTKNSQFYLKLSSMHATQNSMNLHNRLTQVCVQCRSLLYLAHICHSLVTLGFLLPWCSHRHPVKATELNYRKPFLNLLPSSRQKSMLVTYLVIFTEGRLEGSKFVRFHHLDKFWRKIQLWSQNWNQDSSVTSNLTFKTDPSVTIVIGFFDLLSYLFLGQSFAQWLKKIR